MNYLYAVCAGFVASLIVPIGWEVYEWLNSRPGSTASDPGPFSERISDREMYRHLRNIR